MLEDEIRWQTMEDPMDLILGGPADVMISLFTSRTRKQVCLDSVPACFKRPKVEHDERVSLTLSQRKAQKALDKEIPCNKIPAKDLEAFQGAQQKEWDSWLKYDAVEVPRLRILRKSLLNSPKEFSNPDMFIVTSMLC